MIKLEQVRVKLCILYGKMYQLTNPECGQCRVPYSCCSAEYCHMARDHAKDMWGEDLPEIGKFPYSGKVPYLVSDRCIVPPHLRPLCTLHTCDVGSLGCKWGDLEWTQKYWALRTKIETLEQKHDELNRARAEGAA